MSHAQLKRGQAVPGERHQGIYRRRIMAKQVVRQGWIRSQLFGEGRPMAGLVGIQAHAISMQVGLGQPGGSGSKSLGRRATVPGFRFHWIPANGTAARSKRFRQPKSGFGVTQRRGLPEALHGGRFSSHAEATFQKNQAFLEQRLCTTQSRRPIQVAMGHLRMVSVPGPMKPQRLRVGREPSHPPPQMAIQQSEDRPFGSHQRTDHCGHQKEPRLQEQEHGPVHRQPRQRRGEEEERAQQDKRQQRQWPCPNPHSRDRD